MGDFSTETLSFHGARVDHVALGCGHDNEGLFVGAAGLLGLGRGVLSFPSQTKNRYNTKFSYCLVDRTSPGSVSKPPSTIVFGNDSVPETSVFTALLTNPKLDTFYYLQLLGISVGGSRVRGVSESQFKLDPSGDGGVIIDSGTSRCVYSRSDEVETCSVVCSVRHVFRSFRDDDGESSDGGVSFQRRRCFASGK
ncbi:Eukaryotic aspartyl protease family protein [Raphanus sativus]|nr:Eukaryotic aspartyl protease family protein [Raphanus sativus]